jgi:iron complex transport system permease protein
MGMYQEPKVGRDAERDRIVSAALAATEHDRLEGRYDTSQRSKVLFISAMGMLTVLAFLCSLAIGSVDVPIWDTLSVLGHHLFPGWISSPETGWYGTIIIMERFPRTLLCLMTGVSLAAAGTVMQGLLRNPLVSPFTLGVSTAASFGAAIAIVFGSALLGGMFYNTFSFLGFDMTVKNLFLVLMSFAFGMFSILLVLKIARKESSIAILVLSGVVISYLFQAGISFSKYVSDDESLREITNWLMGGMWNATWGAIVIMIPVVIPCIIYLEKIALDINSLSAGDEIARNVGVDVGRLRKKGLIVSTLVASTCVAFTGVIGFIGLMAPHMCRMVIGNDARYVLPASALLGASILMFSDVVARVIIRPDQIPVGIILYFIGGIFFIWMVTRSKMGGRL